MKSETVTKEKFNTLDPSEVCVCYSAPDVYVVSGLDLMEENKTKTLFELVDDLLSNMPRDNFEILMVNNKGNLVKVEII
jgi:hypothetical protein